MLIAHRRHTPAGPALRRQCAAWGATVRAQHVRYNSVGTFRGTSALLIAPGPQRPAEESIDWRTITGAI